METSALESLEEYMFFSTVTISFLFVLLNLISDMRNIGAAGLRKVKNNRLHPPMEQPLKAIDPVARPSAAHPQSLSRASVYLLLSIYVTIQSLIMLG